MRDFVPKQVQKSVMNGEVPSTGKDTDDSEAFVPSQIYQAIKTKKRFDTMRVNRDIVDDVLEVANPR